MSLILRPSGVITADYTTSGTFTRVPLAKSYTLRAGGGAGGAGGGGWCQVIVNY